MTADASTDELAGAPLLAAQDANARLVRILDTADDAIISIDENQTITLFNRGAERIFGYTAAEVIGSNLKKLLPPKSAHAHEELVRQFGASHVQSRRMGERGTVAGRRKDGSEFPAEVSISKASASEGLTYTAILRDISLRVKADQLLREREQRLRLALSAGQMGVFQIDETSGIGQYDETALRLLGLPMTQAESPAEFLIDCAHRNDRETVRARLARARQDGGDYDLELRVPLSGDRVRWIAAHGFCELDAQRLAFRTTGVLYDITDRKAIEQALEARVEERTAALRNEIERREEAQAALVRSQKLQAVGELAGGMAHDFNNLLTVITGNLELLGLRQLDDKARDLIRRAGQAASMGARLVGRLLTIGGRQRLQPIDLDLNEITRSMTDVLKRTLGDAIEIQASFAADLRPALADVSEVENAILNIAINARDAMPGGGKLVIMTTNKSLGPDDVVGETGLRPGDYVMLSISDTGTGMPPEVLARVFEPFYTTKPGRGTGLGLSTIYGFAKQSGGHLTIYSEVGKGTSVRLYLPRADGSRIAHAHEPQSPIEEGAAGETVLVVEDNADVRDVTIKRLDTLGYRVVAAANAPAAIAILERRDDFDLVFSDVIMPGGMSGFDLARWVRANKPSIKVLLTSGFTGEIAKSGDADPVDVELLRKPYAIAELARAVREALS
ncbi:MAG: PAS domain S-box protein [Alphaproteobacteria bacterium]|nr:PAS domain S-box protein [Alphaproteobacteria bacterium]